VIVSRPSRVRSSKHPLSARSGPDTVPLEIRSPLRNGHPLLAWWVSICDMDQY
jgi:hypothetical protein